MSHDPAACRTVEEAVLRVFERAIAEGRLGIAEHLLRALEALDRSDPACTGALEQAYLSVDSGASRLRRPTRDML